MSSLLLPHLPQIFFYFQNRTSTETSLQVEVHEIIFPTSHHSHETVLKKRVVPILLRQRNLSKADFRPCSAQSFCHISFYGPSKLMILDALERGFEGASEY
jgi:hypothetical protein